MKRLNLLALVVVGSILLPSTAVLATPPPNVICVKAWINGVGPIGRCIFDSNDPTPLAGTLVVDLVIDVRPLGDENGHPTPSTVTAAASLEPGPAVGPTGIQLMTENPVECVCGTATLLVAGVPIPIACWKVYPGSLHIEVLTLKILPCGP